MATLRGASCRSKNRCSDVKQCATCAAAFDVALAAKCVEAIVVAIGDTTSGNDGQSALSRHARLPSFPLVAITATASGAAHFGHRPLSCALSLLRHLPPRTSVIVPSRRFCDCGGHCCHARGSSHHLAVSTAGYGHCCRAFW